MLFQPNLSSPDRLRASQSQPKPPFPKPATWTANPAVDPPYQQAPIAKKIAQQMQSSPSPRAKVATPRPPPLSSRTSPSPRSLAPDQREAMTPRLSGQPRNRPSSLQSPRMRNPFTKATTRTKTRSRDTATATRSALVRWWHAIMMLVRESGSICRVLG